MCSSANDLLEWLKGSCKQGCCGPGTDGAGLQQQQLQEKERRNNLLLSMLKKGHGHVAAPPTGPLPSPPTASSSHRPGQQPGSAGRRLPAERQARYILTVQ